MTDQAHFWSEAAREYEQEFIDPYLPGPRPGRNPLLEALTRLADPGGKTVADLGCGIGPLLPFLAGRFARVLAVDFAPGMLERARERCRGLANVEFLQRDLADLQLGAGQVDVAIAVNSLVLPSLGRLEAALHRIRAVLRPTGLFLGIVPSLDGVHYLTMLLMDRARRTGMPEEQARRNASHHAEHPLYDFAFGTFRYKGLEQHFWQPFEVRYRLRRAGFRRVRLAKVPLAWPQFSCPPDLHDQPPPWDWFFQAEGRSQKSDEETDL